MATEYALIGILPANQFCLIDTFNVGKWPEKWQTLWKTNLFKICPTSWSKCAQENSKSLLMLTEKLTVNSLTRRPILDHSIP